MALLWTWPLFEMVMSYSRWIYFQFFKKYYSSGWLSGFVLPYILYSAQVTCALLQSPALTEGFTNGHRVEKGRRLQVYFTDCYPKHSLPVLVPHGSRKVIRAYALETPGPAASVTQETERCCGLRIRPQFFEQRCRHSLGSYVIVLVFALGNTSAWYLI